MRPGRASVSRTAVLLSWRFRSGFDCEDLMRKLSANSIQSTNAEEQGKYGESELCGNDAQAHVYCRSGMGKSTHRNKIHAGLGVSANVFEINSTRAFQRDAAFGLGAALDGSANIGDRHVVEQNRFAAVRKRLF